MAICTHIDDWLDGRPCAVVADSHHECGPGIPGLLAADGIDGSIKVFGPAPVQRVACS